MDSKPRSGKASTRKLYSRRTDALNTTSTPSIAPSGAVAALGFVATTLGYLGAAAYFVYAALAAR